MRLNKVLLVDDDSVSNFISKSAIEKINFSNNIIIKTDGREALEYIQSECSSMNEFPDLILLDLKMPGMDGFEFLEECEMICRNIREHIVIVILTSSRDADDIVRLRDMGNYFLTNKPLTDEKLIDIHHRYFRGKEILR
jgi:CheY-like chemotaxis protein